MGRFSSMLDDFGGLDPELLDEVIGDEADSLDFSRPQPFAGVPTPSLSSSPPSRLGAPAGAGFQRPSDPVMTFDLEEAETVGGEPVMSFDLDEAEAAQPAEFADEPSPMPMQRIGDRPVPNRFRAAPPQPQGFAARRMPRPAGEVVEDDAEPELPGGSRPVLRGTEADQETSEVPVAPALRPRAMSARDAFDTGGEFTRGEQSAIDQGARQDRRRRIGSGILTGLGMLLAAGGGRGSGLGMALAGAGGLVGRSADREQRARGIAGARLERDAARDAAEARMAAEERDAEREDAELELRRMLVGSQAGENEAQAARIQAQTADDAARRAAAVGDAAGMRDAIRARVAAIPHEGTRSAWEARLLQGLDQITDVEALSDLLDAVGRTDVRRGGQGAGGSGGGRSQVVRNPDGSYSMAPSGGRRAPSATDTAPVGMGGLQTPPHTGPTTEIGVDPSQDIQHPAGFNLAFTPAPRPGARPRAARPAPQAAPVPPVAAAPAGAQTAPAASGAGAPVATDTAAFGTRVNEALTRLNVSPADRRRIAEGLIAGHSNRRTRSAAEAELRNYERQVVAQQAPPTEAVSEHWRERVEVPLQTSRQADVLIATLRRQADEIRGAMLTPALFRSESQSDLVATITRQIREVVKSFAGAAVTPQEMQGVLTAMGADTETLLANPQIIINAFQRARDANYRIARANAATFSPETRSYFGRQARGTRAGGQ